MRQRKSVLAAIGAGEKAAKDGGDPPWWNSERWDRELAEDLADAMTRASSEAARRTLSELGIDPGAFDEERTRNYLAAWARNVAENVNGVTLEQLTAALAEEIGEDAMGSTPAGVFDKAEGERARSRGQTLAGQVANWAALEAVEQAAPPGEKTKTWRTRRSRNPRKGHARLNGQTVGIDEEFSNGAQYPGDWGALKASECANCHCTVEVSVERKAMLSRADPAADFCC